MIEQLAGDSPVPFPPEVRLRDLAGVGAVEDFLMWDMLGPGSGTMRTRSAPSCRVVRPTVYWSRQPVGVMR